MARKRKQVTMTVTVSVPSCLTAAEARREVRSLIQHQANWLTSKQDKNGDWHDVEVKAITVKP